MGIYKVDTDNFTDAVECLITAFRRANPTLNNSAYLLECGDGTKIKLTFTAPKKQRAGKVGA